MNYKDKIPSTQNQYNLLFSIIVIVCLLTLMWKGFRQGYEHLNSNFYKRDLIIQYYNHARMLLGDKYIQPAVLVGEDGWLEYVTEETIGDYQNNLKLSKKELRAFENQIKNVSKFGQENNIEILIVIAPNKISIYPDKLTDQITKLGDKSRLDQIIEFITPHPNIQLLDLRSVLQDARVEQPTYFKTDTHWNQFGAYIAYSEITNSLSKQFPALVPYPQNAIESYPSNSVRDLAAMIKANYLTEEGPVWKTRPEFVQSVQLPDLDGYLRTTWIPDSTLPTALIYHDSFGNVYLNEYLTLNFGEAHFIHHGSATDIFPNKYVSPEIVKYLHPNIIIIEVVERNIHILPAILAELTTEQ